jgi:hypothetical protein
MAPASTPAVGATFGERLIFIRERYGGARWRCVGPLSLLLFVIAKKWTNG